MTGEILSTGGRTAHGDLAGVGARPLDEDSTILSVGPREESMAAFWASCLSALAPSFRTVAFGPTELVNWGADALGGAVGCFASSFAGMAEVRWGGA